MTQTSHLSSGSITALDTIPAIVPTSGEGASGFLKEVDDYVTAVSADQVGTTYKLCRIPTNAKVKSLLIYSTIASAGSADINVVFSDSTTDGTQVALQNAIPTSTLAGAVTTHATYSSPNALFGAAQSLVLAGVDTNFTFVGTFTPAMRLLPLWDALGFATDPGGMFDIEARVTTAVTTGGIVAGKVEYVV